MNNFAEKEEGKVFIVKGVCVDKERQDHPVLYKIYGIDNPDLGKRPLIVWSHGLGGSREGAGFISRFLAQYGYLIMHVQHVGTDVSLWEGKDGHPWDVIRATDITREMTLNRYQDIPFLLDQLPILEAEHTLIRNQVDYDRLGVSGHSFGALTAQVMAGQIFPDESHKLVSYKDDRFKAGMLYSFSAMNHLTDISASDIFRPMNIPLFFMTGTEDGSPITHLDYTHRLPAYRHTGAIEKHLLVIQDGDHMIFTGNRGKLAFNPKKDQQEALIKWSSLAFWETYLKDSESARSWLMGDGFQAYMSDEGQYEFRT